MHPQPRTQNKKRTSVVTTVTPESARHSPRNGFTAYFALSSVTTLFDTVACASSHRLDANDWGVRTTRLRRPRQHHSSSAPTASTASRPAFVTIAIRPSCRNETVRISELIWVGRKQKYFCKRGLTRFLKIRSDLPVGRNQVIRFKEIRTVGAGASIYQTLMFDWLQPVDGWSAAIPITSSRQHANMPQ